MDLSGLTGTKFHIELYTLKNLNFPTNSQKEHDEKKNEETLKNHLKGLNALNVTSSTFWSSPS